MTMTKKVAVINDLSGLGRCSLTAAISVLSAMGIQTCPAGNTFIAGSIYENRDRLDDTFLRTFELDSVYLLFCSRRDLWLHPTEKQR